MRIPISSMIVGLASISVLALASCGGGEKAANEMGEAAAERIARQTTGKDTDVKLNEGSVKVKGEGFSHESTETADWPSDMFADVPRFEFGKVERVIKGEEGGMKKFNIFLRDIEPHGVERYVALLKEKGWQADLTTLGARGGMVAGQRGDLGMNFMVDMEKRSGVLAVFSGADR